MFISLLKVLFLPRDALFIKHRSNLWLLRVERVSPIRAILTSTTYASQIPLLLLIFYFYSILIILFLSISYYYFSINANHFGTNFLTL